MNSNDYTIFIREDVFNARMDALTSTIRLENERIRNELNSKIDSVQTSLNSNIENYQAHNERQFSELRSEIRVLATRMEGLDNRMADLQNSISWSFSLAAAFIAVIGIIISVFIAFAPSIWSFIRRKRQPDLSRENVKSLVSEQVAEALKHYFTTRTDA